MALPHGGVGQSAVCDCGLTYFFISYERLEILSTCEKVDTSYQLSDHAYGFITWESKLLRK